MGNYTKIVLFLLLGFTPIFACAEAEMDSIQQHRVVRKSSYLDDWDSHFQKAETPNSKRLFEEFFKPTNTETPALKKPKHVKSAPRALSSLDPKPFSFHENMRKKDIKYFMGLLPANKTCIFFDTETTGFMAGTDRIIEIAFVKRNFETMEETRWYALLNPEGRKSPAKAFECHKIPDQDLVDEKIFSELAEEILAFIGDDILVAHNASFDRKMLNAELARAGLSSFPTERFQCTLTMARQIYPGEKNKLDNVCNRFGIDLSSRAECHGAMQDTLLMADAYPLLLVSHDKYFEF